MTAPLPPREKNAQGGRPEGGDASGGHPRHVAAPDRETARKGPGYSRSPAASRVSSCGHLP